MTIKALICFIAAIGCPIVLLVRCLSLILMDNIMGKAPMAEWLWCQAKNQDDLGSIPCYVNLEDHCVTGP